MKRKIILHALAALFFVIGLWFLIRFIDRGIFDLHYDYFWSKPLRKYDGGTMEIAKEQLQTTFFIGRAIVAFSSLILATLIEILNTLLDRKHESK